MPSPRNYRVFSVQPEGGIALDGCRLLRLALHRHSDLPLSTGTHRHQHHQILVYLRGGGCVSTGGEVREVSAGTGILLPAGCGHRFIRHSPRNPLCLMIDFSCAQPMALTFRRPGIFQISLLRKLVNELAHFKEGGSLPERLQRDGIAAQLLGVCLGMMLEEGAGGGAKHPVHLLLRLEELVEQSPHAKLTLAEAAQRCGYQRDHLNRILKEQSGMTFGQLRSQVRLRRAQAALRRHGAVGVAAEATGFDDVNYFVRWFRKQTGRTPGSVLRELGEMGTRAAAEV